MKDAVSFGQAGIRQGSGLSHCAECGAEIPQARREAISGVRLCVACQVAQEYDLARFYNGVASTVGQRR